MNLAQYSKCWDDYNGDFVFADDPKQGITLRVPWASKCVTITSPVGITLEELLEETNASKQESSWKMTFNPDFPHGKIVGVYSFLLYILSTIPEIRDYAAVIQTNQLQGSKYEFTADISRRDGKKVSSIRINLKE